jgi:2-keto-4-pentenoate hydratase/2-oxohepta-3-ene-1,7-dioic acid hydratase in catechol pathway
MVFGGKVYETDGATAVGVHEASEIRPLSPVPVAPSLRIFRSEFQPLPSPEPENPHFFYGNPASIVGPSQIITYPAGFGRVAVLPLVAAVIVSSGYGIDLDLADDTILGLTLMCMLILPEVETEERNSGGGFGRSCDAGAATGPVLTTPDELDDFLVDQQFGRRYRLSAVARVNGVERQRGNLEHLRWTFAEAIAGASLSCTVREGDILALGSVCEDEEPLWVEPGDEIHLAVENLGTLGLKLSEEL